MYSPVHSRAWSTGRPFCSNRSFDTTDASPRSIQKIPHRTKTVHGFQSLLHRFTPPLLLWITQCFPPLRSTVCSRYFRRGSHSRTFSAKWYLFMAFCCLFHSPLPLLCIMHFASTHTIYRIERGGIHRLEQSRYTTISREGYSRGLWLYIHPTYMESILENTWICL